jgi:hypothetical protein
MIFFIQGFLEDHFEHLGLRDVDRYAVSLANLYDTRRGGVDSDAFLTSMRRMRTAFFSNNAKIERAGFELRLLQQLDRRFHGASSERRPISSAAVPIVLKRARGRRRSVRELLEVFRHTLEARAIDTFWISRKRSQLRLRPESIGQGLLAMSAKRFLDNSGLVLRELTSGIGFVDVAIIFSSVPHLIEMKVLTKVFAGPSQLAVYMRNEQRREGWLVVLDARPLASKTTIPGIIQVPEGIVRVVVADINPAAPCRH